ASQFDNFLNIKEEKMRKAIIFAVTVLLSYSHGAFAEATHDQALDPKSTGPSSPTSAVGAVGAPGSPVGAPGAPGAPIGAPGASGTR
ncbi:MAG: hypothetical protein ACHQUC_06895, partial [Chlamydiales bacterium]